MTPDSGSVPESGALWGIVANYDGDKVVARGAKCWIYGNSFCDTENQYVRVRSRGGRWITKFVAFWKLHNHRAAWLPPTRSQKARQEVSYLDKRAAQQVAERMDKAAQDERARRNMRDIERRAGLMDEHGVRSTYPKPFPEPR